MFRDIIDIMLTRRSIRRYTDRPVPRDVIESLLTAASWAPSAHNRQPWRFAVVTQTETREQLARAMGERLRADLSADHAPPDLIEKDTARSFARITGAPVLIMACLSEVDMDRYPDQKRTNAETLMAAQSTAMAVQNLLLAAHDHGLGACWMCAPLFCPDVVLSVLDLPADWQPQALITLGYPAETKEKTRFPLEITGDMALKHADNTSFDNSQKPFRSVLALAGGVGGAKLADGLARTLPPGALTVIVNTGDDFRHYGLAISPDLDTVMYTLGGVANAVNGWGLEGDTAQMLGMMRRYQGDAWFGLGDKDLATHLLRTQWLAQGISLTEITRRLSQALGITSAVLPMSDDPIPTMIHTVEYGTLPFQEYFVRYRWQPTLKPTQLAMPGDLPNSPITFDGSAHPSDAVLTAFKNADLIVICPSNPMLSVDPILNVAGVRDLLARRTVPCVAVSPLIGGQAVKGPAAKIMAELGLEVSSNGIARYYGDLIDGLVIDVNDAAQAKHILSTDILMRTVEDRVRLAKEVMAWPQNWNS